MKTDEIIDRLQAVAEGGQVDQQNRWDDIMLLTALNSARAQYARDLYYKNKRLNPIFYQKFHPEYESYFQNTRGCYAKFSCPEIISLDNSSDGFRYVGTDPVLTGQSIAFRRIQSRGNMATYNDHPVMNVNNDRAVYFLYDGALQTMELYGDGKFIKVAPLVELLAADPLSIPTFNRTYDQYPLPEDCIPDVERMIFAAQTRIAESTMPTPAFSPQPMPKK